MATSEETVEHLLTCCDALYLALGESAPQLTNDHYVVRVHEMSRSFGELALLLRAFLGTSDVVPLAIIVEVLERALAEDETGALSLYCVALVVGPRLLVSLRDAREALRGEVEVVALLERCAQVTVEQLLSITETTKDQENIDDPVWQEAARTLMDLVQSAGNAESFGISR
jgi:hypothetical protein